MFKSYNTTLTTAIGILLSSITALAQETTVKLPTTTDASSFNVIKSNDVSVLKAAGNGLVGIGATNPRAQLEISGTEGLLVTSTHGSGTALDLGGGSRVHWYGKKSAFRAGYAYTNDWNDANIGDYSIAMGYQCKASGANSIAMGKNCRADAANSIAIGTGSNTNGRPGSVVITDATPYETSYSASNNGLTMRFSGGYRLFTSYFDSMSGVYMRTNANGWSSYCDRNKKENFKKLDGELVLQKIDKIPITEWNYKNGDPTMKYIGPMAQDFWQAFRLAGNDSLGINSICIDGVNMAAIQALIRRTNSLTNALEQLQAEKVKNAQLSQKLHQQEKRIDELTGRMKRLDRILAVIEENRAEEQWALRKSSE